MTDITEARQEKTIDLKRLRERSDTEQVVIYAKLVDDIIQWYLGLIDDNGERWTLRESSKDGAISYRSINNWHEIIERHDLGRYVIDASDDEVANFLDYTSKRRDFIVARLKTLKNNVSKIATSVDVGSTTLKLVLVGERRNTKLEKAIAEALSIAPAQLFPQNVNEYLSQNTTHPWDLI